jgi:hypothetical protein
VRVVVPLVLRVTVEGFKEQLSAVDGDTVAASPTFAANPFRLVTVMVEVPGFPA